MALLMDRHEGFWLVGVDKNRGHAPVPLYVLWPCLCVIRRRFPPDFPSPCIVVELKRQFLERFGDQSLTVPPNGLQGKSGGLLKSLCDE